MKYKEAITKSMQMLAEDDKTIFLGYNISFGSKAYNTLSNIPDNKKIETPLAENLMMSLAIGMSLEGYRPIVFFERHDFILNALDSIVNHLDKSESLFKKNLPVIIRANVGAKKPLYPGCQHIQDFTEIFKNFVSFPVYVPKNPQEIIETYKKVQKIDYPVMIIEKRDLYENE